MSAILLLNIDLNSKDIEWIIDEFNKYQIRIEYFDVSQIPISGCIQCGKCIKRNYCVNDEVVHSIRDRLSECDGLIIASEVVYGQLSEKTEHVMTKLMHSSGNKLSHCFAAPLLIGRENKNKAEEMMLKYLKECSAVVLTSWLNVDWNHPESMHYAAEELAWIAGAVNGKEKPVSEYPRNLYFTR